MVKAKKPAVRQRGKTATAAKAVKQPDQTPEAPPEAQKTKSGFLPLLLGGVLSGALGFGAATVYFINQPSQEAQILATLEQHKTQFNDTGAKISDLADDIATVKSDDSSARALADLSATTAQNHTDLATRLNDISQSIAGFDARLVALEKRPVADVGGVAAAYEHELQAMRDLLDAQKRDIEKLVAEAKVSIKGAAQEAAELEQSAAKATARQAAASQLQSALDSGDAFAPVLADLASAGGIEVPQVLTDAAKDGIPTLTSLQNSFPDAARTGLAASIKATTSDDTMGKLGAFFRTQVGARSLEPRAGDDPDAVLSRAEAALGKGDIDATLALIGVLPQEGQTGMGAWVMQAKIRIGAVAAINELSQGLNGN